MVCDSCNFIIFIKNHPFCKIRFYVVIYLCCFNLILFYNRSDIKSIFILIFYKFNFYQKKLIDVLPKYYDNLILYSYLPPNYQLNF